MKLYCISGLGADRRAFQYLDLPGIDLEFLEWLPVDKTETLEDYARRMSEGIDPSEPFGLLGLSMGGMVSIEIAKMLDPKIVILVSSIAARTELSKAFRLANKLGLDHMLPFKRMKEAHLEANWILGLKDDRDKHLVADMHGATPDEFFPWAIHSILNWKNTDPVPCVRIHGTHDRLLPVDRDRIDYVIEDGGHFMIVNRSEEVSRHILTALNRAGLDGV